MLKLKLQYFSHLMQKADSLEKTLMLGKIEDRRRWGWQDEMVGWHHWLHGHEFGQTPGVGDEQGSLVCYSPWGCKEPDSTEQLNWTNMRFSKQFYWHKKSDSSVDGILQRECWSGWVAILFFRGSSWLRDQTWVSIIADRFFTVWATREAWKIGYKKMCIRYDSTILSYTWSQEIWKLFI